MRKSPTTVLSSDKGNQTGTMYIRGPRRLCSLIVVGCLGAVSGQFKGFLKDLGIPDVLGRNTGTHSHWDHHTPPEDA